LTIIQIPTTTINARSVMDPLRQNTNRVVLNDDKFIIIWDGTHLKVMELGRNVWNERVCATDDNAEQVAHAFWYTHNGKAKVEKFIEHADW
jgi:hypothetical protein